MRSAPGRRSAPLVLLTAALTLGSAGCPSVREDRSITWSPDGKAVSFQHGQEGVFVADKDGVPTKIFQPGPDVLATSAPLWAPDGKRLLFTTARDNTGRRRPPAGEPDPAGETYGDGTVTYTCWLRGEAKDGPPPEPVPLFEAACGHAGFIAANLAVRWHPQGDRILFIKQVGPDRHGLFAFDLTTKVVQQVFPHTAAALVFDWAPDTTRLACVLGGKGDPQTDGIWVGRPGAADWWHVPQSGALPPAELGSLLESLRAARPAWTADGSRLAFATAARTEVPEQPGRSAVWVATPATRKVELLVEGPGPFQDVRWAPDGARVGVFGGDVFPSLYLFRPGEGLSPPVNRRPVRHLAGWSASGEHLAYVVADPAPLTEGEHWAFLFFPNPQARDAVLLADGSGRDPGREVFSGMRVTFPRWSPKEDELSIWFTFGPSYQSWLSQVVTWLPPPTPAPADPAAAGQTRPPARRGWWLWGDPAAVFRPATGEIRWLAVSPFEKAQVGHYHLLKRDFEQAWKWYAEADRNLPPAGPLTADEVLARLTAPQDFSFFEYHCLTKLGRHDEARTKLEHFRRSFPPQPVAKADESPSERQLREALAPGTLRGMLLRDLHAAEVFLNVDAAADGEAYFHAGMSEARGYHQRLSSGLMLTQLLLAQRKYGEYADLMTDTVLPLLLKVWQPGPTVRLQDAGPRSELELFAGLTLLPLFAPEFVAQLPEQQVRAQVARWQALRPQARDDPSRLVIDLFLESAYRRLGAEEERQEAARRVEGNPARAELLPAEGAPALVRQLRELPAQVEALRKVLPAR